MLRGTEGLPHPAIGGQYSQFYGKNIDEQNGGQKDREGDPDDTPAHGESGKETLGINGCIDSYGHREQDDQDGAAQNQFKGCRSLFQDDFHGRFFVEKGLTYVAFDRFFEKTDILGHEGVVEAQLVP